MASELTRYATLIKDNDGNTVVSNISLMNNTTPQIRVDSDAKIVKVPDGVEIGMMKGAKHGVVAGFGWHADHPNARINKPEERGRPDAAVEMIRAKVG